ncbi:MAG: sensor histidine kinase, partial [Kofleriaceae bacterium]
TDGACAAARLDDATGALENAQRELVAVLGALRPPSLEAPWPDGLRDEVAAWSRRTGISADFAVEDAALSPATCEAVVRIVQEALSNVARHAAATRVLVRIEAAPSGAYVLRIEDDGRGVPAGVREGLGMASMRERAAALPRGTFELRSAILGGACVEVTFRMDP